MAADGAAGGSLLVVASLDSARALGGVWEGKIGRAASGPREIAAVTSSQQSRSRSGDSDPSRPRWRVRRGTGEDEEEEVGVDGTTPQMTSENLVPIWLPQPPCPSRKPYAGAAAVS